MLGTPLGCSLIVVKDKKQLLDSFSNDATYLYQTDHDEFNLGKMSIQCGRRNDALKLWVLWKSVGTNGLEQIVDKQFELADTARDYVKSHSDYTDYSVDDSVSICFNYKGIPAEDICTLLYEHSELLVGYGSFREDRFIRLVTINATNEKQDILKFFKTMETFVAENEALFMKAANG
jgi:sulfinoalanine decarboxylase/sulfinoalanine decarboxylase/aspartate 1-decarboxylase